MKEKTEQKRLTKLKRQEFLTNFEPKVPPLQLLSEGGRGTLAQDFRTLPIKNADAPSRAISALAHDGTTGEYLPRTVLSRAAEQRPAAQPVRFNSPHFCCPCLAFLE
jgi:hypothetical protein